MIVEDVNSTWRKSNDFCGSRGSYDSCVITAFGSPKLLSLSQRTRGKHACSDGVCQTPRVLGICYSKTIQQETENRQNLGPTVEFN